MTRRLEWANGLRGIAAMSVVVFHYGVAFFLYPDDVAALVGRPPLPSAPLDAARTSHALQALPVDLGAFGVGLFFLLSGFVIAMSLEKYDRRGFIVSRCLRVLPTYAAGYLLLCGIVAVNGDPQHELHLSGILAGTTPGLHFLLGVPAPADGVVWTLIIEFVFYGICLVGHRSLARRWQAIVVVAIGCVVIQALVAPPPLPVGMGAGHGIRYVLLLATPFIPVMLIGLTLSGRSRGTISPRTTWLLVPGLAAVHEWLMVTTKEVGTSTTYKATFVLVIVLFCLIWSIGSRWRKAPVIDRVADISYPLYVVHQPLGYTLLVVLAAHHVRPLIGLPATVVVAAVVAWIMHLLVERPTHSLGQRWSRPRSIVPSVALGANPAVNGPDVAGRAQAA